MTIIRVGTSKSYNENWDLAFGGKRGAGATATKSASSKTVAKRSAATRGGQAKKKSAPKGKVARKK